MACGPQVQWEECWWQASNRYGLRELGAFKKGTAESGAAWVEEWKEVLYTHPTNLRLVIERTAHKWVLAPWAWATLGSCEVCARLGLARWMRQGPFVARRTRQRPRRAPLG